MSRAFLLLTLALGSACVDKAKADYDKCVQLDHGYDVKGAQAACSAAVAADPNSPSGQAAAKKLIDLQSVTAKLTDEQRDRAARNDEIKNEQPVTVPTATASAQPVVETDPFADAGAKEILTQAHAMALAGDRDGARAFLSSHLDLRKPSPEVMRAAKEVCKGQRDAICDMLLHSRRR